MSLLSRLTRRSRSDAAPPSGDGVAGTHPPSLALPDDAPPKGWARDEKTPPEVLRGRYEFTRQFSDLTRGKRNWQLVAFGSLALLALSVVGLVTLALQSRVVPYVVEVDRLGRAEAIAPADAVPSVSDLVVTAAVARFVADIRTAYPDPVAQRDAVYRAYAHVAGEARGYLEGYFSDPANDPRQQGRGYRRAVEVTNVLPVPGGVEGGPTTYRVQWNEREESPREGTRERAWEGYLSVTVAPPTTTEAVERNPLGVYVTDLSWSPLAPSASDVDDDASNDQAQQERPVQQEAREADGAPAPDRRPVSAPPRREAEESR
jgi:type IV secretion system protein VirB5